MILKKRALKAYQAQLTLHPLPRPQPINLPVAQTKAKSSDSSLKEDPYAQWYTLPEEEVVPDKKHPHPQYEKYRKLVITDMVFRAILGLVIIGLIVNMVLL